MYEGMGKEGGYASLTLRGINARSAVLLNINFELV